MSDLLVQYNKFQTLNTSISPTKLPKGHMPYVVNYTYDEFFSLKKIRGNTQGTFGSYIQSAPVEEGALSMVDCYWDGTGVHDNTVLKSTYIGLKWPSDASSIPTSANTPVYTQISLTTTATGGGFIGKMYKATEAFTEATAAVVAYATSSSVDIVCSGNNTQYSWTIPAQWRTDWAASDYAENFGVIIVSTAGAGEFHSSSGVLGYGTGADGNITISADTNITTLYETTLGHGAGSYNPESNVHINAVNFTINAGATLTATAWDAATNNKLGCIVIDCQGTFTNNGTINLGGKGGNGGTIKSVGITGKGSGGGHSDYNGNTLVGWGGGGGGHIVVGNVGVAGTPGGIKYGVPTLPTTTWRDLYGSGGGKGWSRRAIDGSNDGGAGGPGGGLFRVRATYITNNGTISCNGDNGAQGAGTIGQGAMGGGGSAGTAYLEAKYSVILGSSLVTAKGGISPASTYGGLGGGIGANGRIYVVSPVITGTTIPPYETNT